MDQFKRLSAGQRKLLAVLYRDGLLSLRKGVEVLFSTPYETMTDKQQHERRRSTKRAFTSLEDRGLVSHDMRDNFVKKRLRSGEEAVVHSGETRVYRLTPEAERFIKQQRATL